MPEQTELLSLSDEKRVELQSFLISRFDELNGQRSQYDDVVKEWVANYNSISKKKREEWEHNYFLPYTFAIIKSIFPRLYFSLFGNLKWLKATAETREFVGNENQMSTYMQRYLDQTRFKEKMFRAIKRAMIYPNCIIKEFFDLEKMLPSFDIVDYHDYWQDITYDDVDDAPDCFNRILIPKSQAELKYKNGKFYKDTYENFSKTTADVDLMSRQATIMNYFLANGTEIIVPKESATDKSRLLNTELLEWHGMYDVGKDGENVRIIATMANRTNLVRVVANPFEHKDKAFRKISVDEEPVGFYGKTYTQILEKSQYMLNDLVNYRYDNMALMVNKVLKVRRNSVIDYGTLFSGPGNIIELDDLNDMEEMDFKSIINDSYQQENLLRSDMQMLSGMIDTGSPPEMMKGAGATATGLSLLMSDAVSKYREPLDTLKDGITLTISDLFQMLHKFAPKIKFRSVKAYDSYDVYHVTEKDFQQEYKFNIELRNFMPNKQMVLQNLVTLLNIVGNIPGFNIVAYVKNIFDLMDEIKNPEEILPAVRQQTEQQIAEMRAEQKKYEGKTSEQIIQDTMTGAMLPNQTPEEMLINQSGLPSPLNPQATNPNDMQSIQNLLGGVG